MPLLEWTDEFVLGQAQMDDTHREFVDLVRQLEEASDHALLSIWREFVTHTEAHFAQEDAWMTATRFAAGNCHSTQHEMVLRVLREAGELVAKDARQLPVLRAITRELAVWFPQHAGSMDAALARHLASVGFDPVTGTMSAPERLPSEAIHGCGGDSCSDSESTAQPASTAAH